jgi:hypothetical protein
MDQQENIPQFFSDQPRRPTLLTVICILSFIGSGLSAISLFMVYASFEEIAPMLQDLGADFPGMEVFASATKNFFLAGSVLNLFSFIGIHLMWRMKKAGFHFYTGAQVLIILLPMIYIQDYPLPILDGIITALFIGLYATHYKMFN